jgi:hypothetical protein
MKRFFFLLLVAPLLFIACKNDNAGKKDAVSADSTNKLALADSGKTKGGSADLEKIKEQLGNLNPLTKEELSALLPEQLLGANRSGADVNDGMGAFMASADYKPNDSTSIRLEIIDCAGPGGAGLFSTQYLDLLDDVDERDSETTFFVKDFNNYKAFESCMRNRPDDCIFTFFNGSHFLVSLQGKNVSMDGLKDLAKGLKLK